MPLKLQNRLRRLSARLGFDRDWYLVLVAAGIGLLMGAVATAFIFPLRWIEEWAADPETDQSLLRILVIFGPAVGGLLAGAVMHYLASNGGGPGVSTVIYAIHRNKSRLPLTVAIRKWIASTLTIGSGGSAGAEGPIVTIGSSIGSSIGRWLRTNPQNTATLLGCGAAAGISSVFNAPIAGIFFVLEILLRDFSLRTFTPIVIASVVSAAWTQTLLMGAEPLFPVTENFFGSKEYFTLWEIPNYFLLGVVCGVAAALFIRLLYFSDLAFSKIRVHPILKPALGGAILGLIGLAYVVLIRPDQAVPGFYGNGYPVTKHFLDPATYFADPEARMLKPAAGLLLVLLSVALLKGLSTCVTIGSGGAGGLFAPSLLMGATIGGAFGVLLYTPQLFSDLSPAHYALVGMAAMVASTTHAPLTGIIVVYEITRSEEIILPLMLAAVISTVVSRIITRDSVYTWKLTRMGLRIGAMSDLTILRRISVSDVPLAEAVEVRSTDSAQRLLDLVNEHAVSDFVVTDDSGDYRGMVVGSDLRTAMLEREAIPLLLVNELERDDLPTVTPDETLDVVLDKFSLHDVHSLAVLDESGDGQVLGLITRERLMRRYHQALAEE